jgi:predicted acylesterase/phospholipase RssA
MAWRIKRGKPAYDSRPLRRFVESQLHVGMIRRSPVRVLVHATDLDSKRQLTFTNESEDLIDGVIASASLPGAFEHVEIMTRPLVDGGVVANTPIHAAIDAGAELITVVYLDNEALRPRTTIERAKAEWEAEGPREAPPSTALDDVNRSVEAGMTAHLERDMRMIGLHNELIAAGAGRPGKRPIELRVIRPQHDLGGSTLCFDREFIRRLISRGVRETRDWLEALERRGMQ